MRKLDEEMKRTDDLLYQVETIKFIFNMHNVSLESIIFNYISR